jgi:hypothetical protein
MFYAVHCARMLTALRQDHRGGYHFYYLDVPFEETIRRHATKPQASEYGRAEMSAWYRSSDLLPGGIEDVIPATSTLGATVGRILRDTRLPAPGAVARLRRLAKKSAAAPAPLPLHAWRCVRSIRPTRLPTALSP